MASSPTFSSSGGTLFRFREYNLTYSQITSNEVYVSDKIVGYISQTNDIKHLFTGCYSVNNYFTRICPYDKDYKKFIQYYDLPDLSLGAKEMDRSKMMK